MQKVLRLLGKIFPVSPVYAHCDIPCGIYDPHNAQMAVHTVIRMTNLIQELKKEDDTDESKKKYIHQLARYTKVKEEHAEMVKHEVRILWGDYFKEEHLKDYPELHDLVLKTLRLASRARQEVNFEVAKDLLVTVQKIAEVFYKTKGVIPVRLKAPYPTEGELVLYK